MDKRGETTEYPLWTIIEIILTILLIVALYAYVDDIRKENHFKEKFLSRDIALLVDLMQSAPGDMSYTYDVEEVDMAQFNYLFSDNYVSIGPDMESLSGYPYYDNKKINNEYSDLEKAQTITFTKKGANFHITEESIGLASARYCPDLETEFSFEDAIFRIAYTDDRSKEVAQAISVHGHPLVEASSIAPSEGDFAVIVISVEEAKDMSVVMRYMRSNPETTGLVCRIQNSLLNAKDRNFGLSVMPGYGDTVLDRGVVDSHAMAIHLIVMLPQGEELPTDRIQAAVKSGVDSFEKAR